MDDVFLGIGSNVGNRVGFILAALRKLRETTSVTIVKISSIYETEPVGVKDQDSFLNGAVRIQTSLSAKDFHVQVKNIEREVGRLERVRWGPREIDIDILLFGGQVVDEANLKIPHPEMQKRRFVLQPLAEIGPDVVHPVLNRSMKDLLRECTDTCAVELSRTNTDIILKSSTE